MLPNRESGPQNQPRAKVAVSVLTGAAASMGGIILVGVAVLFAPLMILFSLAQPKIAPVRRTISITPGNSSLVALLRTVILQFLTPLTAHEIQGNGIYAIAEACRRRTVLKHMSKMCAASLTRYLCPKHTVTNISGCFNVTIGNRNKEAGPARPRIELGS